MDICWLCLLYITSRSRFALLRYIAPPHHVLAFNSSHMRSCVSLFAMACALQDGETPFILATRFGHADAVQALLDAGADRYAKVRMTPCSLMTAHEIILCMGYCCSSLTEYGFFTLGVMMMYPAGAPCLVCAHGVHPGCGISCVFTG